MDFTHSATLPIGVFYQGQLHRDFTVRVSTVGDEIAVVEDGIPDSGTAVGVLARCITALGSIPAEDVTYQLLCDTLVAEDYKALRDAQQEAKKAQRAEERLGDYRYAIIRLGQYGYSEERVKGLSAVALSGVLDAIHRLENPKGWKKSKSNTVKSLRRPRKGRGAAPVRRQSKNRK